MSALVLGLAFLASAPGVGRASSSRHAVVVPAPTALAPAAVAATGPDAECARKAGHQFNHCRRVGFSEAVCLAQAAAVYATCINGGCDPGSQAHCENDRRRRKVP